jgi:hypothetical protein
MLTILSAVVPVIEEHFSWFLARDYETLLVGRLNIDFGPIDVPMRFNKGLEECCSGY